MERRRRGDRKRHNLERWMISYADFMTLLLAVFVVMYSISSINAAKYREIATVLSQAFTGRTPMTAPGNGARNRAPFDNMPAPVPLPVTASQEVKDISPELRRQIEARLRKLDEAYRALQALLADMIRKGQVRVSRKPLGVVIDISATLLFDSGKADLTSGAIDVVDKIGGVLKGLPYQVQVNGFTDNVPIHTAQFSSNWDLSATRAMSVVKRFVDDGVQPQLLVGAGYGEYHPVAANDTPVGMASNRRVSIVVVSPGKTERAEDVPLVSGIGDEGAPSVPSSAAPGSPAPEPAGAKPSPAPASPVPAPARGD